MAAGLAAALLLAPPAGAALRFKSCGYGYACARLSVPLDRTGAMPGRVSLAVQHLRARRRPRRGATFLLAGGPGQSATEAFNGDGLGAFAPAFRNRDLIVFDQRGTGRSGLLRCRAIERANLLDAGAAAAACAAELGERRGFYTTRDSVADIEAIRRALGYRRISLLGISYGSKVALGYALRHPRRVERLVLDSVVEADGPNVFYLDSIAAVPRALRALCRAGCGRFTRDPVRDLERLVARLAARPLRGNVIDARGRRRRVALERRDLLSVLLAGDFDPALRAALPGAVSAALAGDVAPLLRLGRRAVALEGDPPSPRLLSTALYAATTCEEAALPWPRATPPDPATRRALARAAAAAIPDSAFRPLDRATALDNDLIALCERWPARAVAPALGPGPLPDVPVLLLEGEDDLRTPVESARRLARLFRRARLVVAPATGHSALGTDPGGCTARALASFFANRRVETRCRRVRREYPPTAPPARALARVPGLPGVPGLRGRALAAIALTLRDVGEDSLTQLILDERDPYIARGGGLRAGRYLIDGENTLTLSRLEFVPGVRLSGRVRRFGERRQRGSLRVSGRASPDGVLAISGNEVSGRLGGRRVRASLRPRSSPSAARAVAARLPGPAGR